MSNIYPYKVEFGQYSVYCDDSESVLSLMAAVARGNPQNTTSHSADGDAVKTQLKVADDDPLSADMRRMYAEVWGSIKRPSKIRALLHVLRVLGTSTIIPYSPKAVAADTIANKYPDTFGQGKKSIAATLGAFQRILTKLNVGKNLGNPAVSMFVRTAYKKKTGEMFVQLNPLFLTWYLEEVVDSGK
jgi:hypothetical protein